METSRATGTVLGVGMMALHSWALVASYRAYEHWADHRDEPLVSMTDVAIPFVLLALLAEAALDRWWWRPKNDGMELYFFQDTLTNLNLWIFHSLPYVLTKSALLLPYAYLYRHHRVASLESGAVAYGAMFVAVDFCYYWFHRFGHIVNFAWAAHSAHHSSEFYNLSVALRQGLLQKLCSFAFYLPLALFFHPQLYLTHAAFNALYQFWIHSRLVGPLPAPIEWLFNTPSHHRVHHGRNPQYVDRNFGGTLIVWDRLFGTFAAEREPVVYGIVNNIHSFSPLVANADTWHWMWKLTRAGGGGVATALTIPLRWSDWTPAGRVAPPTVPPPERVVKWQPPLPGGVKLYLLLHWAIGVALYIFLILSKQHIDYAHMLALSLYVLFATVCTGLVADRRPLALPLELLRLALQPAVVLVALRLGCHLPPLTMAVAAAAADELQSYTLPLATVAAALVLSALSAAYLVCEAPAVLTGWTMADCRADAAKRRRAE